MSDSIMSDKFFSSAACSGGGRAESGNSLEGSSYFGRQEALFMIDTYKPSQLETYLSEGRKLSNMTALVIPRSSKDPEDTSHQVVVAGTTLKAAELAMWKISQPGITKFSKFFEKHSGGFPIDEVRGMLGGMSECSLPLLVEAVPEGLVVERGTPILRITARPINGKTHGWVVPMWLEEYQRVWYSCTTATIVAEYRDDLYHWIKHTVPPAAQKFTHGIIAWDFGARAGSSFQSMAIGGLAVLQAGVTGSDTMAAIDLAHTFIPDYVVDADGNRILDSETGEPEIELAAGNIRVAFEHNCMMKYGVGLENELRVFREERAKRPTGIFACPTDTSDPIEFLNRVTQNGPERDLMIKCWQEGNKIQFTKTTLRPDSKIILKEDGVFGKAGTKLSHGDSIAFQFELIRANTSDLPPELQCQMNAMGFWELPFWLGIIYGDSLTRYDVREVRDKLWYAGWSACILFGIGGNWHQRGNERGRLDFTAKANQQTYMYEDGHTETLSVAKTLSSKVSPLGPQKVIYRDGKIIGVPVSDGHEPDIMVPIYDGSDGIPKLYNRQSLKVVRENLEKCMGWVYNGTPEPKTFAIWHAEQTKL
jgi:nicotinic acid phosphoribosyltransferase